MTLDEFAGLTRLAIARADVNDYLPTACYPARRHLMVLEGFSTNLPPEDRVLKWASSSAGEQEEFLVAFRIDAKHFKIIRRVGPFSEDEVFALEPG
jgi:hypothetical protein